MRARFCVAMPAGSAMNRAEPALVERCREVARTRLL